MFILSWVWDAGQVYGKGFSCPSVGVQPAFPDVQSRLEVFLFAAPTVQRELLYSTHLLRKPYPFLFMPQRIQIRCKLEIIELQREIDVVIELSRKAIYENARTAQDRDDFNKRNSGYLERHRVAKERMEVLEAERSARMGKAKILEGFIRDVENRPSIITEFEDNL